MHPCLIGDFHSDLPPSISTWGTWTLGNLPVIVSAHPPAMSISTFLSSKFPDPVLSQYHHELMCIISTIPSETSEANKVPSGPLSYLELNTHSSSSTAWIPHLSRGTHDHYATLSLHWYLRPIASLASGHLARTYRYLKKVAASNLELEFNFTT